MSLRLPIISRERFEQSDGVNDSWTFRVEGIGKDNSTHPYVIVNEWISANIAWFLHLPIPAFSLFQDGGRATLMFGSIKFSGDTTPPISDARGLWQALPRLCTGITLFDILVANSDRHRGNLKVDDRRKPTKIFLFDHDRTLLHIIEDKGGERLETLANRLGVGGGSATGGNRHFLIDEIDSDEHFAYWLDRIREMPETFIGDVCDSARRLGARKSEVDAVREFLLLRRFELPKIIKANRQEFTGITNWTFLI